MKTRDVQRITIDYTIGERPLVHAAIPSTPPPELSDLAKTLDTTRALRIVCTGKDDTDVLRIQAKLNGYSRRYHLPFSVATERKREDDATVLYAWAVPLRAPRKRREE